ncbi:hypothetical protein H5410_026662 [Solanum commersonii]|uniref:Uncharacterized protein n=1 Tax=Solanum commersonii TaxID=4109 RepID=A0A9J5YXN7_SOLCO|nr:hypothetical protein H5410_026662 [Solanum commersonii]
MTTKTKNPSKIGPTGYWLPFFAVVSGTAPRLELLLSWNYKNQLPGFFQYSMGAMQKNILGCQLGVLPKESKTKNTIDRMQKLKRRRNTA